MRTMMIALAVIGVCAMPMAFGVVGCGGDSGGGGSGGGGGGGSAGSGGGGGGTHAGDMAILSACGHPGDTGNSIGVGKFCMSIGDCSGPGLKTNICSALGNGATPSPSDTYFCTIYPCHPVDGGVDTAECGDNADCVCGGSSGGSGCACTPTSCK